ncbi:MAG: DUF4382 domain-containing protein [Nanoarchaeota archaeon]|nr:DUF4382 domain-containing protein [Nanoarchaeota archaeon]
MQQGKRIITLIFFLLGLSLIAACTIQNQQSTQDRMNDGRVVFAITDAATDIGAVTSIKITVESVKVHSETEGWVTVSSMQKTYDLLQLKAQSKQELLADVTLKEGTYNQLRLDISRVVVIDASGSHEAKLPSGELKINGNLVVEENSTSTATFDFIADESLHITGNGQYIMTPVVQMETRQDANVSITIGNRVEIRNGRVNTNIKVGMNLDGDVGEGLKIKENVKLFIKEDKIIEESLSVD